jgi:hypothetical protein
MKQVGHNRLPRWYDTRGIQARHESTETSVSLNRRWLEVGHSHLQQQLSRLWRKTDAGLSKNDYSELSFLFAAAAADF